MECCEWLRGMGNGGRDNGMDSANLRISPRFGISDWLLDRHIRYEAPFRAQRNMFSENDQRNDCHQEQREEKRQASFRNTQSHDQQPRREPQPVFRGKMLAVALRSGGRGAQTQDPGNTSVCLGGYILH
jgi:hypothetical protein